MRYALHTWLGNTLTFTTSGASSWSLEGWYKATGEETIDYLVGYHDDPAVYSGDIFAWSQEWTTEWPSSEEKQYLSLPPGHYTMHVRNDGYEGNVTFLVH